MKILLLPLFPHHPGRNIFVQSEHLYIPKTKRYDKSKTNIIHITFSFFFYFLINVQGICSRIHYIQDTDLYLT